jgi:hypothetical protein
MTNLPISIREQLLQTIIAKLQLIAQANDFKLFRSPAVALERKEVPALVVFPEEESVDAVKNVLVDRHLIIRLLAVALEAGPNVGEIVTDQMITAAHSVLMANRNLDGLCQSIKELGTEWEIEDADSTAVQLQARYQIDYRTQSGDVAAKT